MQEKANKHDAHDHQAAASVAILSLSCSRSARWRPRPSPQANRPHQHVPHRRRNGRSPPGLRDRRHRDHPRPCGRQGRRPKMLNRIAADASATPASPTSSRSSRTATPRSPARAERELTRPPLARRLPVPRHLRPGHRHAWPACVQPRAAERRGRAGRAQHRRRAVGRVRPHPVLSPTHSRTNAGLGRRSSGVLPTVKRTDAWTWRSTQRQRCPFVRQRELLTAPSESRSRTLRPAVDVVRALDGCAARTLRKTS